MRTFTLTLILTFLGLGSIFSQTAVDPTLYLDFETEKVPSGETRVTVVDSTNAVHPNPSTVEEYWMEYPGGKLVDDSDLGSSVLQIDNHSWLKVTDEFFSQHDQWTVSYFYKWLDPGGRWWTGIGQFLGYRPDDTLSSPQLHLRGNGGGDGAQLEGMDMNSDGNWFQDSTWYHITISHQKNGNVAVHIADTVWGEATDNFNELASNSYWISAKMNNNDTYFTINHKDSHSKNQEAMIDDLRLWDIGLSADEVASLYNNGTVERTYVNTINVGSETGSMEVKMTDSLAMTAEVLPGDASVSDVEWSVTDGTGSAAINDTGLVSPQSVGTVTVTASAIDGSGVEGTAEVTITGTLVDNITLSSDSPGDSVKVDNTLQIHANVDPDDAADTTLSWSVENGTGSAVIDEEGVLTGVTAGTVTVVATANDGSGTEGTLEVTVWEATEVSSITLSSESAGDSVQIDESLQIYANVEPDDAADTTVSWSVEEGTGAAEIDSEGLLTPTSVGTVTVIATANDGSGTEGTLEVTIFESTGLEDLSRDMTIYPNPSSGQFTVTMPDHKAVPYGIYDVTGTRIQTGLLEPNTTIELNDADKGVYFIRIKAQEGDIVKKLIVK